MTRRRIVSLGLAASLFWAAAMSSSAFAAGEAKPPEEAWTDLSGRVWTQADLDGRIVLLEFWATWCASCPAEFPHLRRLQERCGDELLIFGVALDTIERRRLHSYVLRHDMTWPQIHEKQGADSELARRFAIEAVPATVLIDQEGRVIARNLPAEAAAIAAETLLGDSCSAGERERAEG